MRLPSFLLGRFSRRSKQIIVRAALESLEPRCLMSAAATISTDNDDYMFGESANISGSDFAPSEMVQLQVTHVAGTPGSNDDAQNQPWLAQADADGHLTTTWLVDDPDAIGATYNLTATGTSSGATAQTTFTDASQSAPTRPDLDAGSDSGVSNIDNVTKITTPKFTGTVRIPTTGSAVTVELWFGGGSFIASTTVTGVASATVPWSITVPGALNEGVNLFTARASHMEGATTVFSNFTTNLSVTIDTQAPTVNFQSATTSPNANGWYKTNVTIPFIFSDAVKVQTVSQSSPLVLSAEGSAVTGGITVTDSAGNSAVRVSPEYKIDKTAPLISAQRVTLANASGWNNTDVVASYSASDNLALADAPTGTYTFTSEGTGQSHAFTVTDLAGNSTSATVSNVNIDKTAPTLSFGSATTAANASGWYNTDVTVPFTFGDCLSGIASSSSTSPIVLTSEGSAVTGSVTLTDVAGNTITYTTNAYKIDKTAPVVGAIVGPDIGVPGQLVSFTDTANDALSGVVSDLWNAGAFSGTGGTFSFTPTDGGSLVVTYAATDAAGNSASSSKLLLITGIAMIDGNLYLGGTRGDDNILITPNGGGDVKVSLNGTGGVYHPTGQILVFAGAGNDNVQIAGGVDNRCYLFGGAGNDRLNGGNGGGILFGGDGNDEMLGGNGNDILVGGQGADRMVGNGGDDILIAGFTAYDTFTSANKSALDKIIAEWSSSRSYVTRINNLVNGSGSLDRVNGSAFLNKTTVFDDTSGDQPDTLTGAGGDDWYIYKQDEDVVTGVSKSEAAESLLV